MAITLSPQQLAGVARQLAQQGLPHKARTAFTMAKRLHIAGKIQRGEKPVVYIVATSDDEKDEYMKFLWGDYWVQYELIKSFGSRGYRVSKVNPDILIHLYGHPRQLPQQTYNIVWIYSNPDTIRGVGDLQAYDSIYVLSESYKKVVQEMGRDSTVMVGATSKTPSPITDHHYPAVFVGNARRGHTMRPVVECLSKCTYPFKVWGNGWDQFLTQEQIGGRYFDNQKLDLLYANSDFAVNDHHADMCKYGFVAVKIFDILASGGFAISDKNHGINEIFGDSVPQFSTAEELQAIFDRYAPGTEDRIAMQHRGREIALRNRWQDRTDTFIHQFEVEFDMARIENDLAALSIT
jgi:hypothetical protein